VAKEEEASSEVVGIDIPSKSNTPIMKHTGNIEYSLKITLHDNPAVCIKNDDNSLNTTSRIKIQMQNSRRTTCS
jgi:hypothetical protein